MVVQSGKRRRLIKVKMINRLEEVVSLQLVFRS